MDKNLKEEVVSGASVDTVVVRDSRLEEKVQAGQYNKVQFKKRDWKGTKWTSRVIKVAKHLPGFLESKIIRSLQRFGSYSDWYTVEVTDNLIPDNGRDLLHNTGLQASAQPAGGQYVALSADAGSPTTSDTTLTAELTVPSGLARALAAYAHTAGTNTSTLIKTFTNDGASQVAGIRRSATFNAASTGVIGFSNTFTSVTLEVNDQLQVTWTITIG